MKDSFIWRKGAILEFNEDSGTEGGYSPINDVDVWDTTPFNGGEYISSRIVESTPEWFERVYPIATDEDDNFVFKTQEETTKAYGDQFSTEPKVTVSKFSIKQ